MKFSQIVKQAREKKGLSQVELASYFGRYGGAVFNDLENEEFIPRNPEFIIKLAEILDLDSDILFQSLGVIPDDVKEILLSDVKYFRFIREFRK